MNKIEAVVTNIEQTEIVTYIHLACSETPLRMIKTKIPAWLGQDERVLITFQEASVCVSKECPGKVSIENKVPGTITKMRSNGSLCELTFDSCVGKVVSLITEAARDELGLEEGGDATMLIRGVDMHLEPIVEPMDLEPFKPETGTKVAN